MIWVLLFQIKNRCDKKCGILYSLGGGLTYFLCSTLLGDGIYVPNGLKPTTSSNWPCFCLFVLMLFHGKGWSLALWFVACRSLTDGWNLKMMASSKFRISKILADLQVKHGFTLPENNIRLMEEMLHHYRGPSCMWRICFISIMTKPGESGNRKPMKLLQTVKLTPTNAPWK